MRLFIALFLPSEIEAALIEGMNRAGSIDAVRWLPGKSLHITLKFLGETPEDRLGKIEAAIVAAAQASAPLKLQCEGGGAFPSLHSPKVFWTAIIGDADGLRRLAGALDRALAPAGFPVEERDFHPHLTIGRYHIRTGAKRRRKAPSRSVGEEFMAHFSGFRTPPFTVDRVHLVRSRLHAQGVEYEVLRSIPFNSDNLE
jgi:2'-5' RNA ligase